MVMPNTLEKHHYFHFSLLFIGSFVRIFHLLVYSHFSLAHLFGFFIGSFIRVFHWLIYLHFSLGLFIRVCRSWKLDLAYRMTRVENNCRATNNWQHTKRKLSKFPFLYNLSFLTITSMSSGICSTTVTAFVAVSKPLLVNAWLVITLIPCLVLKERICFTKKWVKIFKWKKSIS